MVTPVCGETASCDFYVNKYTNQFPDLWSKWVPSGAQIYQGLHRCI